jgi:hypothetical protein
VKYSKVLSLEGLRVLGNVGVPLFCSGFSK